MSDGRRAEAGLVGEDAPGEAVLHGLEDYIAEDAAAHGFKAERTGENLAKGAGDHGGIAQDHAQADDNVKERHKGHQIAGDRADAVEAAQDHDAHQHHEHDAGDEGGVIARAGEVVHGHGDLRRLGGVADAEGGQAAQNGKDAGQPLHMKTPLDVVHGAAVVGAVGRHLPVVHGQDDLGILGAHAEKGRDPHPEHRAGAAGGDGAGHAGHVAHTDGAAQRRGDGLEGRHIGAV